jgi:hypothetical protein
VSQLTQVKRENGSARGDSNTGDFGWLDGVGVPGFSAVQGRRRHAATGMECKIRIQH